MQYNSPLATLPVEFVGSFPDPTHRLAPVLPEVVSLGRSNVGKSSLLNAIFDRPLAKVSGTPGRTALLNVFRLPGLYLLDLPGYGYARVSHSERARYGRLVKTLIEQRSTITGVLWLLDIRHEPSPDDLAYAQEMEKRQLPILVALTKADKLPHGQRLSRLKTIARQVGLPEDQVQLTSCLNGLGIVELGESILAIANPSEAP